MTYIMVDIEADGAIPYDYSMIAIGAVIVDNQLDKTFYRTLKPISEKYNPDALAISGFSREQTLTFEEPLQVMLDFEAWITKNCKDRPIFISDNNGFDWLFVCWYFHHFLGRNPFGFSSQNLGSLYKGLNKDMFANFKHLRTHTHTHNALDDAIGNAGAMLKIIEIFQLKIKL